MANSTAVNDADYNLIIERAARYHRLREEFFINVDCLIKLLLINCPMFLMLWFHLTGSYADKEHTHLSIPILLLITYGSVAWFFLFNKETSASRRARYHRKISNAFWKFQFNIAEQEPAQITEGLKKLNHERGQILPTLEAIAQNQTLTARGANESQYIKIGWFRYHFANIFNL